MSRYPLAEELIRNLHAKYQGDTDAIERDRFWERLVITSVAAGICLFLGLWLGWLIWA